MSDVKVSIIIPTYNAEKYISRCLDSLLNQSFELSYEIIVSLNGCKDKTLEIVAEYSRKYNNIVIINNPNKLGAARSRMAGIEISKGDYLLFVDADDYVHQDHIKRLYDEAQKGYDIVCGNVDEVRNGKVVKNRFKKNVELNTYQTIKAQLLDSYLRSFSVCKLIKSSLFKEQIVYYPKAIGIIGEDTITLFQVFKKAEKVRIIKDSLYYYDKDVEGSNTNSINLGRFDQHLSCFAFIRHLIDIEGDKELLKIYKNTFWRTKLSLWFDAYLLRKEFHHSALKHLRLHKKELKLMINKKPLPIEGEVWEQYIKDCYF